MSLLDHLPHTCDVKRPRYEGDGLGGDTETYETRVEDLECWVQPASQREIAEFAKRDEAISHKVYFAGRPAWTTAGASDALQVGDQLHVTSGEFDGFVLEYKSADDAGAGLGVVFKAMTEKVR